MKEAMKEWAAWAGINGAPEAVGPTGLDSWSDVVDR